MPLTFEIPDDIVEALRLPPGEADGALRAELAIALYARGALSIGKAAEMSRLSRWAFEDLLGQRKVVRNYGLEDLQHDLARSGTAAVPQSV